MKSSANVVMKNREKILKIGEKHGSAALSRNLEASSTKFSDVLNFYNSGKKLFLETFVGK